MKMIGRLHCNHSFLPVKTLLFPQVRGLHDLSRNCARTGHTFLKSRVALAGCLVGDGKMGTMESDETAAPLVAEAVEKYAGSIGIRLVGFKDFPARTRSAFSSLYQAGYSRVTGFPPLILDLNFASFEEVRDEATKPCDSEEFASKISFR